jgi:CMP/dCMP kinase
LLKDIVIAIDGPVASGKSAVGRRLASRLSCLFLDTGLMYRAVTLSALQAGVSPADSGALARLVADLEMAVEQGTGGETLVKTDGQDLTAALRSPEVDAAVSQVSAVPAVREKMVQKQRELAAGRSIVMVGRDIGTVVLPEAHLKVYLQAGIDERARRRHAEVAINGDERPLEEIRAALAERDRIDSERDVSPLRAADDAHIIETDGLTVDQVVERIERLIQR